MQINHPRVVKVVERFCAEHALALGVLVLGLWTLPLTQPYLNFLIDTVRIDIYCFRHISEYVQRERAAQEDLDRSPFHEHQK